VINLWKFYHFILQLCKMEDEVTKHIKPENSEFSLVF
jgi:hypothetical protein